MTSDQESILNDLLDLEDGLTGWEVGFVDDLDKLRTVELSPKQAVKLDEIWDRLC